MSQAGRAPILLIVVMATLGLGLGASMYLNYNQYSQAEEDRKLLKGEITDLRYQLDQDQKASPSPSPGSSSSPSPAASPTPTPVLGTQSVVLAQLGVRLSASAPIADLTYQFQSVRSGAYTLAVANLTTTSLMNKYANCRPGAALGQLVRRPIGSRPSSSTTRFLKKIGDYNYYYVPMTSNCGTDSAGRAAVAAAQSYLAATVLPTLTAN